VIGTLYQRYVNQARGLEQVPNYELWSGVANKIQVILLLFLFFSLTLDIKANRVICLILGCLQLYVPVRSKQIKRFVV
jgi:hypothetical protein